MSVIERELDHGNETGWTDYKNLDQKLDRLDDFEKRLGSIHKKSVAIPQLLTAWEKIQEKFKTAVQICSDIRDTITTPDQVSYEISVAICNFSYCKIISE